MSLLPPECFDSVKSMPQLWYKKQEKRVKAAEMEAVQVTSCGWKRKVG